VSDEKRLLALVEVHLRRFEEAMRCNPRVAAKISAGTERRFRAMELSLAKVAGLDRRERG